MPEDKPKKLKVLDLFSGIHWWIFPWTGAHRRFRDGGLLRDRPILPQGFKKALA